MDLLMEALHSHLERLPDGVAQRIRADFASNGSTHPFSRVERLAIHLLRTGALSFREYRAHRSAYRRRNPNATLFAMTNARGFGETWGEGHIAELLPGSERTPETPDHDLQHDSHGLRLEVKSARVVSVDTDDGSFMERALPKGSKTPFTLRFLQVRPAACDVLVLVAVWMDDIGYWVIPSEDLQPPLWRPGQHRDGSGMGTIQVDSDQLHRLERYRVDGDGLAERVARCGKR